MGQRRQRINMFEPAVFLVRIEGRLGESWSEYFGVQSLSVEVDEAGQCMTQLISEPVDQAALVGMINLLNGLGLPVVSVECLPTPVENDTSEEGLVWERDIDRDSLGSHMLEHGKVHTEGGKLVIYVQHDEPADPKQHQNWLPAPKEGFRFVTRLYGPYTPLIDGSYDMPGDVRVGWGSKDSTSGRERIYCPEQELLEGKWEPAAIKKA